MYRNQNAPKRWIDPSRKAELAERDRIRQAHYAKLERAKLGLPEPQSPDIQDDVNNPDAPDDSNAPDQEPTSAASPPESVAPDAPKQPQVPEDAPDKVEPKYFTQLAKKGWYNVIGPAGVPVNATLLRLEVAEKKATRMNNGANR